VTFDTILSDLGMGLAMVPIIAILEQVAIAKAFCESEIIYKSSF
jgi:sodium-independent sulfate anion transporter 11